MSSITDHANPRPCEAESFADTIVAIDGNIQLYQFLTAMRNKGDLIRNHNDEPISHLLGIFNRTTNLLEHGVKPVFVFDGGYPDLKAGEVQARREQKQNAQQKFEEARKREDVAAMERWGQQSTRITSQIQSETERVLDLLNVPYIVAPSEADPQVAKMVSDGPADYAATEDFDTIVHGADAIVRSFNGSGGEVVSLNELLDDAEMSYEELVWASIASGTDYNESPYRVGWVRASNMAKKSDSFDDLVDIAHERDSDIDRERWYEVKAWFDNPNVTTDYSLDFGTPNKEGAYDFLVNEKGLMETQITNALEVL